MEKITTTETENRQLGYSEDFKEWIREHPGVIALFKELSNKIKESSKPIKNWETLEHEGIKANVLKDYIWDGKRFLYLKVEVDGKKFFVKSEGVPHRGKGFTEFINSAEVQDRLKDLKARTIRYKLGYQDSKRGSFFVSEWENNIMPVSAYKDRINLQLKSIEDESEARELESKLSNLEKRLEEIRDLLKDFHDLEDYNIFYDPNTDEVVLMDLFKTSQDLYQEDYLDQNKNSQDS